MGGTPTIISLFNDAGDYTNPIEPSAIGGAKLATISAWIEAERSRDRGLKNPETLGQVVGIGTCANGYVDLAERHG